MTKNILFLGVIIISVSYPFLAFADAGIPLIAIVWPLSWVAFIPIVVIEHIVSWKQINLPWRNSLLGSLMANIVSTFIGIPLTMCLLMFMELFLTPGGGTAYGLETFSTKLIAVTIQAPILLPYYEDFYWMIPSAILFILPILGIISVFVERPIFRKFAKCDKKQATLWSWFANCITYGILIVIIMISLITEIVKHG